MFNDLHARWQQICAALIACVLLASCVDSDRAAPDATVGPTDVERVRTHLQTHRVAVEALEASPDATWDDFLTLCDRTWASMRASGIEPGSLSPDALALLYQAQLIRFPSRERDDALANLAIVASREDERGAGAAVLQLELLGSPFAARVDGEWIKHVPESEEQAILLERALRHAGIADALRNGCAATIMLPATISGLDRPDLLSDHRAEILALASWYTEDANPRIFLTIEDYLEAISTLDPPLAPVDMEAVRARLVAAARAATGDTNELKGSMNVDEIEWLTTTLDRLDGAAARNALLGHPAPGLEFLWSSTGQWESLEDLKGRVVVIDFWTTWCAPCVASFPRLRELQERYADAPVVILGVTSPQGRHVVDGAVVDCKGDPEREFSLMQEYIRERDITWPVVFTRQDVYNPEYGVSGIPHVAIIDRDGIVRHRALHTSDFEAICTAIDALVD